MSTLNCDPSSLAQQARCFRCDSPATLLEIQVYLLCQIVNNGGTGGSSSGLFYGAGNPNTLGIVAAAQGNIYTDFTNPGAPSQWVSGAAGTGSWTQEF